MKLRLLRLLIWFAGFNRALAIAGKNRAREAYYTDMLRELEKAEAAEWLRRYCAETPT